MKSVSEKLDYLAETKNQIKQAIIDKGGSVSDDDTFRSYVDKISNLEVGGGGSSSSSGIYLFQVIDYDGTVLTSSMLNEGDTATLPSEPTHDGLVFDGWSSPVTITDGTITMPNQDVTIGPMYSTASGNTEIDIELTKVTGLDMKIKSSGTIDWGDGSSNTGSTSGVTHTYADYGEYTISISGSTSITGYIAGQSSSAPNYTIKAVRIDSGVTGIEDYAFFYCYSLTSVTIPDSVTSIGMNAFRNCYSLKSIAIPSCVTSIENYAFKDCWALGYISIPSSITIIRLSALENCYTLARITLPNSLIRLEDQAFSYCRSLRRVKLPGGITYCSTTNLFAYCSCLTEITLPSVVTSLMSQVFNGCYSLTKISIPSGVTSLETGAIGFLFNILTYDFSSLTQVPTLGTCYSSINSIAKIIVPDDLYDEWIEATNWATYADYIYKVSEVEI